MKITFLGTGANGGTPQLDCKCKNCLSATEETGLTRTRSSFFVEVNGKKILVECGPDFWWQMRKIGLKLQDLDLIVISHLHFDHANGLLELSGGKKWNVPVFVSKKNRDKLMNGEKSFLVERGFVQLVDDKFANNVGVSLVDIPHDSNFPTSGVVVRGDGRKVWFSTDVEDITTVMKKEMKSADLVVFDATFFDESVFPARKFHHMTIERSLLVLKRIGTRVIFSHINHSESAEMVERAVGKQGFGLASDGLVISV